MTDQPQNLTVGLIVPGSATLSWHDELADALASFQGARCVLIQGPTPLAASRLWRKTAQSSRALKSGSMADTAGMERAVVRFDPEACWDILIDLSGHAPIGWAAQSRSGIWRLVDERGQALDAAFPCIAAITRRAGGHVSLIQTVDDRCALLRYARVSLGSQYMRTIDQLYKVGAQLITLAIIDQMHDENMRLPYIAAPIDPVSTGAALLYLLRGAFWSLVERVHRTLYTESWMIGVIDGPVARVLSAKCASDIRWVGRREMHRYLADPFGVPDSLDTFYCEVLDQRTNTGMIKEMRLKGDEIVAESCVDFPVKGHLSYPFLFLDDGVLYCMPEASASRRCDLYVRTEGGGWRLAAPLLTNTAAVDSTIFKWQNRYWLAYTDADQSAFDNLCLSYADRLEGPWRAHANNPVKIDHRSARSAGNPFMHEGELYRPAQDCSKTYGGAVAINRVTECSPSGYKEEVVSELHPLATGANPHGLHTFSQWGNRILVDGKRHVINPVALMRKVALRARRVLTKISGIN